MGKGKLKKILLTIILSITVVLFSLYTYGYYIMNYKYMPSQNEFTKRVAYIDFKEAKLTEGFKICDSTYMVDYYNYSRGDSVNRTTTYIKGKNGLRKEVLSKYENRNYSDSGYLNYRFIVNCKGEAGAYVIHQNDLDLKPKTFNTDLTQQLFEITTSLKKWQPNYMRGKNRDSYMYISYKIENGEITEILP